MKQRIAYIWLPRLQTDRITRIESSLRKKPLAIVCETHNGCCLHAINTQAQLAGLTPGMMLPAARTICPQINTRPLDLNADQKTIDKIARHCRAFTPLVARDGFTGLFLDTTGCAHLFGDEKKMLNALTERLKNFGFDAFTALADTPGAAWALARFGNQKSISRTGKSTDDLAPLPVAGLRLDNETTDTLNRLGLKQIKDLYPLARASLAARFGMELVTRLDQARGTAPEPLEFDREAKPYKAHMRFAEPIVLVNDVETSLDHLLEKICARLEKDALGARKLILTLTRVDNTTQNIEIGTVAPTRSAQDIKCLFKEKIDSLDSGFGFERITLQATIVHTLTEHQTTLSETNDPTSPERAALINQLANRLGPASLKTYAPHESHMPERAYKRKTPTANTNAADPFPALKIARPIRLFHRPISINFATPASDGTKTMSVLGQTHTIHHATGPERIAAQWWHSQPLWPHELREYWWIISKTGERFWVFKQRTDKGTIAWFLHGLGS